MSTRTGEQHENVHRLALDPRGLDAAAEVVRRGIGQPVAMQRTLFALAAVLASALWWSSPQALAQQALVVKPLAERKVPDLPQGPLFWRIENFGTLAQAQEAAGPWALATESAGKVWLFTLGAAGGSSPAGTKVVEFGPIPRVAAAQYLLRINEASGPPGSGAGVNI